MNGDEGSGGSSTTDITQIPSPINETTKQDQTLLFKTHTIESRPLYPKKHLYTQGLETKPIRRNGTGSLPLFPLDRVE